MREWHEKYEKQGLVVIGNHYPEFEYEEELDNLKAAVKRLGVPYPVLQDNEGKNWSAYGIRFWPSLVIIDKEGHIRFQHIGEGRYTETEEAFKTLLNE